MYSNHIYIISILALLAFKNTKAQIPFLPANNQLLQKLRSENNKPNMSYDYTSTLKSLKNNKTLDSIAGRMYVSDGQYIDSSIQAFTARVGDYFCKIDHQDQTATIANMPALAKKMGIKIQNNEEKYIFNITDSMIARYGGTYSIDSTMPAHYRLQIWLKNYPLTYAQIDFKRATYKISSAFFRSEEPDPNDPRNKLRTEMQLSNVQYSFSKQIFELSRIYTIKDGKPILSNKYAKYTLIYQ